MALREQVSNYVDDMEHEEAGCCKGGISIVLKRSKN
jgi:hypothetical protein